MHLSAKAKRILIYSLSLFLFLLAGLFQAIDSSLPEFYHALLALLAHTIFLSLSIAWGISIIHRMVRKDLLFFFVSIAVLIVFFFVVRMIKYGITEEADTLSRYLWYSYYVPECLIPPLILLSALSLERKENKPLCKWWYLLFVPALIIVALIYTNDLHMWAFRLSFEGEKFSYRHGPIFYLALTWEILVTLLGLIVMFYKFQVSSTKKKIWVPLLTFFLCAFFSTVCFLANTSSFKIPELLCFTCIALLESGILIGLVPSNTNYIEYFRASKYRSFITDEKLDVIYASQDVNVPSKESLSEARSNPILITNDLRLSSYRIGGGYVYWATDLSDIHRIHEALKETNAVLQEENDLLLAENKVKEDKAKIEEQTRLYGKVEESLRNKRKQALALLKEIKKDPSLNYQERMEKLSLLLTYIKRRSNLVLLSEKSSFLDIEEVSLSIKESLNALSPSLSSSRYQCDYRGKIPSEDAYRIYDAFEEILERFFLKGKAIDIHLLEEENLLQMTIEVLISPRFLKEKELFEPLEGVSIKKEGEKICFRLSIPKKKEASL